MHTQSTHVLWFEDIGRADVSRVGGKNASLGEMVRSLGGKGIKVPPGFATTAEGLLAICRSEWAQTRNRRFAESLRCRSRAACRDRRHDPP